MVKILLLVSVMLILMLLIASLGYLTSKEMARNVKNLYENYAKTAILTSEAKALAFQNRALILTLFEEDEKSDMELIADEIKVNRIKSDEWLNSIDAADLSREDRGRLERLKAVREKCVTKRNELVEAGKVTVGLGSLSARIKKGGDIEEVESEYVESFTDLTAGLMRNAEEKSSEAWKDATKEARRILFISVTAIISGLALGIFISHTITGSIGKIQNSVKLLADGDLKSSFALEDKDELGGMSLAIQGMADNLKYIAISAKRANVKILDTSHEFSEVAKRTNASVEAFSASIQEMSANLDVLATSGEEVNASVQEVAAGAQTTAEKGTDIAKRIDDAMGEGGRGVSAVRKAVAGIEHVVSNVESTVKSVRELSDRSRNIQNFVMQIGGIADQTNLLALNAAIEAARAGEAGRGFAVVAEEVRKLAEDSNAAAKNIAELASAITVDLNSVVAMSEDNAKASEEAKVISKETEKIIENMMRYMEAVSGATQDLAAVAEEQAASSEEIAGSIQNISVKVQDAAQSGDHMRAGVGSLSESADQLARGSETISKLVSEMNELLAFFKADDSGRGLPSGLKGR
jgi:methyl-accepting chemotaxis protein